MKKYKTGLVIGRFQPFHLGHKYVIGKALELCEKIYIGIGTAQIFDDRNPYGGKKIKKFLETFVEKEMIKDRVVDIVFIEDVPDDDEWCEYLFKKIPHVDAVVGDNEWVNEIFERHGIPAVRIGYYKRDILEGTKIRKNIKDKKPWEERVPDYLISHIKEEENG